MSDMLTVQSHHGQPFKVEISDEVCGKFGFRHGDRIKVLYKAKRYEAGTIIGVAPALEGTDPEPEVIWFRLDIYPSFVSYCFPLTEGALIPI